MSFLGKFRKRVRRHRGAITDPARPTPSPPRPKRVQLPPRPSRTIGSGTPAIQVDTEIPQAIRTLFPPPHSPDQRDDGRDSGILIRDARSPHRPPPQNSATWWWVDTLDEATAATLHDSDGEAILVASEDVRAQIEHIIPRLIGDVWVAAKDSTPVTTILDRYYPNRAETYQLGLIGYNLKFVSPIITNLVRNPGVTALIDEWPVFAAKPTVVTDEVIARSDIVLSEWCGPNAVYASQNKRAGQRLFVRLHRFELETDHWRHIDHNNVDMFITVGDHYRTLVLERTDWPPEKVVVIGNQVDDAQLRRSKTSGYRFNVGMLGASSSRKRIDIAFDLIEKLHNHDRRFRLHVKTAQPQEEKWVWDNERERDYFDRELARLETDPLRSLVTFDGYGPDVADWFRKIGFIVSTSDDESFHLAPAEGMVTGALPVVRNWPGADTIYSSEWVFDDVDRMVERILTAATNDSVWDQAIARAGSQAAAEYGMEQVVNRWADLFGRWSADTLQ